MEVVLVTSHNIAVLISNHNVTTHPLFRGFMENR